MKTVVLDHLLDGANAQQGESTDDAFMPDVKKFFDGQVIVAADQMRI